MEENHIKPTQNRLIARRVLGGVAILFYVIAIISGLTLYRLNQIQLSLSPSHVVIAEDPFDPITVLRMFEAGMVYSFGLAFIFTLAWIWSLSKLSCPRFSLRTLFALVTVCSAAAYVTLSSQPVPSWRDFPLPGVVTVVLALLAIVLIRWLFTHRI